ncbi:TPA: hypothetical protein ACGU7E_002239 [Vibrio vulnificus]|nr:hypothetical protein [Vibrio vulnificus]
MKHKILYSVIPTIRFKVVLLTVVTLAGCASNESITMLTQYAEQTTKVQDALMNVYESADDARISAELVKATRDGITGNRLNIATIDNSGQELLLHNLQQYSQSIYALATNDRSEALNKYSQKLNESLVSLSESHHAEYINSSDIELLSTSVNAIARAYTEKSRYDLLKSILIDSESIIQSSYEALKGELGSWKQATKISLEKELQIRLYLLNNPNRCEELNDRRCVTFHHSLEERVNAYRKTYELKIRLNDLDANYAKLERALGAIQQLNKSIVVSLKSDDDLTKGAAKKALQSTKMQIDAIKDFRDTLGE